MKVKDVKVPGRGRVTLEVHPAAELFPLLEGDEFDAFVEDVRARGFIHGIAIQGDKLLDGRNRLRAGQKLGIDPPVVIIDKAVDPVAYIISTNRRRHLTESQRAWVAAGLANLVVGANQHTRTKGGQLAPSQAEAASLMQVSPRSVTDARRVIDHGAPELVDLLKAGKIKVSAAAKATELTKPEQRKLVERVSKGGAEIKSGKVVALARQQAKRNTVERINSGMVRPLSIGPFALICVDYPWPYKNSDGHEGSRGHIDYPSMPIEDIYRHAKDVVGAIADTDAILAMWVTNAFIDHVGPILAAAGFELRTMITWDKLRAGVGTWPRGQTEHLVIASRGNPVHTLNEITTYHPEERREPGRKPDRLMAALAKHCPGPHLELFAREQRPGWSSWGAEVGKFVPAAAAPPAAAIEDAGDDPLVELLAEPWTCRGRPMHLVGAECGHLNTVLTLDGISEVCGKCGCLRPLHGSPGKPAKRRPLSVPPPAEPSLTDLCPKCRRELGEHNGKKCPPARLLPTEFWTCRARHLDSECGHVNMVRTLEAGVEVCGKCGCTRGTWGNGRPTPSAARAAPTLPDRDLKPGNLILVRWLPCGEKRARFVRYTRKGDLVVNVQAVDTKGKYLKRFGSDRTFAVGDYLGRAPL